MLRNVREGWSEEQRRSYFAFINEAGTYNGGNQYAKFLEYIREDALANCSDEEKAALVDLTEKNLDASPIFESTPTHPVETPWTVESAEAAVKKNGLTGRSFANGENAFNAVTCARCHRFNGAGGAIGPDLTSVNVKFSYTICSKPSSNRV